MSHNVLYFEKIVEEFCSEVTENVENNDSLIEVNGKFYERQDLLMAWDKHSENLWKLRKGEIKKIVSGNQEDDMEEYAQEEYEGEIGEDESEVLHPG